MLLVIHFEFLSLNAQQKTGIWKIVEEIKGVFVNLPTGFGKSFLYQALPLMFTLILPCLTSREPACHGRRCLTIDKPYGGSSVPFEGARAKAANISSLEHGERTRVEYSLVYGPPEAWLENERWRFMLTNFVYSKKLCAIAVHEAHVVRQW